MLSLAWEYKEGVALHSQKQTPLLERIVQELLPEKLLQKAHPEVRGQAYGIQADSYRLRLRLNLYESLILIGIDKSVPYMPAIILT